MMKSWTRSPETIRNCMRLGPGDTAEIPETHVHSRECLRYYRDGMLRVETAEDARARTKPKPDTAKKAPAKLTDDGVMSEKAKDTVKDAGKADVKPGDAEAKPDKAETKPDTAEAKPDKAKAKPDKPSATPKDKGGQKEP